MGTLYFKGTKEPSVGMPVLIVVNSVNSPTGIWRGEIVELFQDGGDVNQPKYWPGDTKWVLCNAKIVDPSGDHNGEIPSVNYQVYDDATSVHHLLGEVEKLQGERKSLERRLVIEREVFHGLMKALTSRESFTELKKLLDDFLSRFSRR